MKDPYSWKQEGAISLWQYTEFPKKFGGWHVTGDDAGIASLLNLLQLLTDAPGIARTVTITPPTPSVLRVPNFQNGRALWVAPTKWRVQCTAADGWLFPPELEPASLTVGGHYVQKLNKGLGGIPKGEGDFCIGQSDSVNLRLCFWWWLGAA